MLKELEIKALTIVFILIILNSCKTPQKDFKKENKLEKPVDQADVVVLQTENNIAIYKKNRDKKALTETINRLNTILPTIKQRDKYIETLYYLGVSHQLLGQSKTAADFYKRALTRKNNFKPALINLAQIYIQNEKPKIAIKMLKKYYRKLSEKREVEKNDYKVNYTLALAYYSDGDLEQARELLLNLIEIEIADPSIYLLLAQTHVALKMNEMAIYVLDKGMALFPKDPQLSYFMSQLVQEEKEERVKFLEKAILADKDFYPARVDLFEEFIAARRCDEAQRYILKERVDNLYYNLALGRLYACLDKENESEEAYKRVLRFDKNNKHALYNLGDLYYSKLNKPRIAIKYFRQYVTLLKGAEESSLLPSKHQVLHYISVMEREIKKSDKKREEGEKKKQDQKERG